MAACRSCAAEILWAKTVAGKSMPLDAEPHPDGNITLGHIGGEECAIVVTGAERAAVQIEGRPLYRSHFATCPNADEHRVRAVS